MRKSAALSAVLACLLAAAPALAKEWKTVRIAMDPSYAPWSFTDSNGELVGFEIDLARDLCSRMKVECELIGTPWDGIIPSLQVGKFDAIIAGMSITPKRQEVIDFSVPYADSPRRFVTLKSNALAEIGLDQAVYNIEKNPAEVEEKLASLRQTFEGKTIGVLTSTSNVRFLEEHFADVATIREYKTAEQYVLDLAADRIDVAMDNAAYLGGVLAGPDGQDMVLIGPGLNGGMFGAGRGVGIRKSDPELRAMFDEAIQAANASGTIADLSRKWFNADISPR